jgi:hypothetical protein
MGMPEPIYTKKRIVDLEGGSQSYQIWNETEREWKLWILAELAGEDIDVGSLEDVSLSDAYVGDPISMDGMEIPTAG